MLVTNYPKKVTTGNTDETGISSDAFTLVTFFLNIAKDWNNKNTAKV